MVSGRGAELEKFVAESSAARVPTKSGGSPRICRGAGGGAGGRWPIRRAGRTAQTRASLQRLGARALGVMTPAPGVSPSGVVVQAVGVRVPSLTLQDFPANRPLSAL
jgi:hypothetical protein